MKFLIAYCVQFPVVCFLLFRYINAQHSYQRHYSTFCYLRSKRNVNNYANSNSQHLWLWQSFHCDKGRIFVFCMSINLFWNRLFYGQVCKHDIMNMGSPNHRPRASPIRQLMLSQLRHKYLFISCSKYRNITYLPPYNHLVQTSF